MSMLPIVVEFMKRLKKTVNENIQCVHGYAYYSGKQKMCTWVNEESWGIMKTCFPDAKQIQNSPKTFSMQIMYIRSKIYK